jgi:flagellar biosynthesis chaperone FliJ
MLLQKYERNKINYLESCEMGTSIINATVLLRYLNELDEQIKLMRLKMQEAQELINIQTQKLVEVTKDKAKVEKLKENKFINTSSWKEKATNYLLRNLYLI